MVHLENITQKSDYQLRWIAANKPSYSKNEIKAALLELKKREKAKGNIENIKNNFRKLQDFVHNLFEIKK